MRFKYLVLIYAGLISISKLNSQNTPSLKLKENQPNIIFILTDDLGYGDVGVLFQNSRKNKDKPYLKTPNLDKMAREGMLLTRHYAPAPVCAPSRASLILGVHQGHAEVRDSQFDKAILNNHTIASILKSAGYNTALIGKWGLQGLKGNSPSTWEAYPTKRGFDYFLGYVRHEDGHNHYPAHKARERGPSEVYENSKEISPFLKGCYTTDLFTAAAKKWIINHEEEKSFQPFFLELAFDTPHAGLQIPSMPYPDGGGVDGGIQLMGTDYYLNTVGNSIDDYYEASLTKPEWEDSQKRFANMVYRIDQAVGDIMQLLKDLNIDKNTLVIFTSDNGPHDESYGYGNYAPTFFESFANMDGIKRDTWEAGIREPAIVRWPGHIAKNSSNNTPSSFYDWMPTFSELAGIPAPAITDGQSLVPILFQQKKDGYKRPVYIEYNHPGRTPHYEQFDESHAGHMRGQMQVIYLDGYKGIRTNIQSADTGFEIYDTERDPKELQDLANSSNYFKELEQRMHSRVLQIRRPNTSASRPYDTIPVAAIAQELPMHSGLKYKVYSSPVNWVPDVNTISTDAIAQGKMQSLKIPKKINENATVIVYNSYVKIPKTGSYDFSLRISGKAVIRIHDATLFDADKLYKANTRLHTSIYLGKGYHPIQITLLINDVSPDIEFLYKPSEEQTFKKNSFSHKA